MRADDCSEADAVGEDSFDVQRAVGVPVPFQFFENLASFVEDRGDVRVGQVGQAEV